MTTHTFMVTIDGLDVEDDEAAEALIHAGCDDASIGSIDDTCFMDFDREAPCLTAAIASAIRQIESVPGLRVDALVNDSALVSMADIARRTGRSREGIRLLVNGERGTGGFPAPVTDPNGHNRMWESDAVARWMADYAGTFMDTDPEEQHQLGAFRALLEMRRHARELPADQRADLLDLAG